MNTNEFFNKVKEIVKVETTEKLFEIESNIPDTCPYIDKALKISKQIQREVNSNSRWVEEDYKNAVDYTESYITDIDTELEELRTLNENIRVWGQSWKTFAKDLLFKIMKTDISLFKKLIYLNEDLTIEQEKEIMNLLNE